MPAVTRRYSKVEFARRGDLLYETTVRPKLSPKDTGKFVGIDIDTGEYELDADEMAAGDKLQARLPEAQIWMVRVGYRAVHRFVGRCQR